MKKIMVPLFSLTAMFYCTFVGATVVNIENEDQFNKKILKANGHVLVKFSANWCGVCQNIAQPFEELADEEEFKNVMFAHVDIDKNANVSQQNGIIGVPTFLYLDKGNKKGQDIGIKNMASFKDNLRSSLRKTFNLSQNNIQAPPDMTTAVAGPSTAVDVPMVPEQPSTPQAPAIPKVNNEDLLKMVDQAQERAEKQMAQVHLSDDESYAPPGGGFMSRIFKAIWTILLKIKDLVMWVVNAVIGFFSNY